MDTHGKALLAQGKALPTCLLSRDNQAVLSTAHAIKLKLAAVLEGGLSQSAIAQACGVSKQAVQGWKNTGRVDKKHLPALAQASGRPLSWWLDYSEDSHGVAADGIAQLTAQEARSTYAVEVWPFIGISPAQYATLSRDRKALVEGFVRGLLADESLNKSTDAPRAA